MIALRILKKGISRNPYLTPSRNISEFRRGVNIILKRNLLIINSLTSGGCMLIGDLAQQEFEFIGGLLPERYDWSRAGRMFLVGTLMGPLHHYYYVYLDKILPKCDPKTVLKKVLCDQTIAGPLTILFFYYGMGFLEEKTLSECNKEISDKFKYVYMGDCMFWPPVQIINFYYLPTEYRVIYINVATMIFNVFMSYMKHYDQH